MKVVIDTSCVLAVLLNEEKRQSIIEATYGADLFAPDILHAELGNALSSLFKKNRIGLHHAIEVLQKFQVLPISLKPINVPNAIDLSHRYMIYAYDAYFLELCMRQNYALLTLDAGMKQLALDLHLPCITL